MAGNKYRYQVGQKVIVRERRFGNWYYKVYTIYRVGATIGVFGEGMLERLDRVYPKELVPYSEQLWSFVQSHLADIDAARAVIDNKIKLINGILDDAKAEAEREQAAMYERLRSTLRSTASQTHINMEIDGESEADEVDTVIVEQ